MGLTNATPMQRVTLILLRLLLGAVIAVAVCGQLGSRVIVLSSPVGVINLAIYRFGIMVEYFYDPYSKFDFEFDNPRAHSLDDDNDKLFRFYAKNVWFFRLTHTGIFGNMDFTHTASLPGVVVGCGNLRGYDYKDPSCFALAHYFWVIASALLVNVAAHWRVHRKTLRAKSFEPLANS